MNDYRIAYTTETGESQYSTTTERTEAAARKYFNAMNRGLGFTITSVELIRENTCATKQQERDALAAIKKMVEELGPQSYLATAFEGCFEDAESNIENDFGDSYKRRCESAERKLNEATETIEQLKSDISLLSSSLENERALTKSLEQRLEQETLSADDLTDCRQMAENLVEKLRGKVKVAEATILEYAEHPETATFVDAVRERKNLTTDIEYYKALAERLCGAQKAPMEQKGVA